MVKILDSLSQISADYDVLFCDLWGCLHNGRQPYPAAVEALLAFRAKGGRVCLMTNAPRPSAIVIDHLERLGVPRDAWDIVVSSGDAGQRAVAEGLVGTKIWHLGPFKDDGFFATLPQVEDGPRDIRMTELDEADGIVCTGLFDDRSETPEDYRTRLASALERDLPMLCANPDIIVDLGDQRLYCAGALAQLYEEMGGRTIYGGKPHAPIYELARERLGLDADARILCIGDGINTDVEGAMTQGLDSIFITGGIAHDQFGDDVESPDQNLLETWLNDNARAPTFAMGRLR